MYNLVSFLESTSPLDYPIQAPLVLCISLCTLLQDGLILSSGSLTFSEIDCVCSMKCTVYSHLKGVESPAKFKPKHTRVYRELNPSRTLCWMHTFKDLQIYGVPYTPKWTVSCHEITGTSAFLQEEITTHS